MARPSKYKEEYAGQAEKLARMGLINDELAKFFEVGGGTIDRWIASIPEFKAALLRGRILADANVADALYQRACGYQHEDVDIRTVGSKLRKTKITKYYPPDTAAAFIWLKNRQPDRWRDKTDPKDASDLPPPVKVEITVEDARVRDA